MVITNYEIKQIAQETVIVLHLDFSLEIGSFDSKEKESFLSIVKKYIKKLDIKEHYQKILLMSGSIVVATLVCINDDIQWLSCLNASSNNVSSITLNTELPSSSSFVDSELVIPNTNEVKEEKIDVSKEQSDDTIKDVIEIEINKVDTNKVQKPISNESSHSNKINTQKENQSSKVDKPKEKPKAENPTINVDKTETKKDKTDLSLESNSSQNSKQMVTIYRSNGIILEIGLEEYIVGVVAAEMPASFSNEALKAQSVVARTYALRKIFRGERLTDTVSTQAYIDMDQMKSKWGNEFEKYYNKIKKAVSATEGEFITYQGNYINAVYHSTSNGYTEDAVNVWKESYPYLKSVESSWDKNVSSYERTITKDFQNLLDITGLTDEELEIKILSRDVNGRVQYVQIGDKIYTGIEFRNLLGLRSADFDIEKNDNNIKITTRGYGHGVGMSQYGANEMAKAGYNYRQIINHYYTGVQIQK